MTYELLDNISRADIAYRARGNSLAGLFTNGAGALVSIMLEDPGAVRPAESVTFTVASPDLDLLYYDFLTEFIFYKDSEKLILIPSRIDIRHSAGAYTLTCEATGEKIDRQRHVFITDIKAITLHNLSVTEANGEWQATVVVDV